MAEVVEGAVTVAGVAGAQWSATTATKRGICRGSVLRNRGAAAAADMAAAAVIGAATIADSQVICPEIVQSLDKAAVAEEEEEVAAETATTVDSRDIFPATARSLDRADVEAAAAVVAADATATIAVSRGTFPAIAPKGVNSQLDRPSSGLRIGVLIRGSKVNKLSLFLYVKAELL